MKLAVGTRTHLHRIRSWLWGQRRTCTGSAGQTGHGLSRLNIKNRGQPYCCALRKWLRGGNCDLTMILYSCRPPQLPCRQSKAERHTCVALMVMPDSGSSLLAAPSSAVVDAACCNSGMSQQLVSEVREGPAACKHTVADIKLHNLLFKWLKCGSTSAALKRNKMADNTCPLF